MKLEGVLHQHSCEGIDLPLPGEAKLVHFGMDLYQELVAKLEGLQRTAAVTEMKELGNGRR